MATSRELRDGLRRWIASGWPYVESERRLVVELLDALDREDEQRRAHAERLVGLAALRNVADGECCDVPEEAGP